ncbi:glutamyl-tRNA(Gln) amidotransferase [Rhodonellum psychrophilum GCM71 = DSM 17998]|uniref:Glutamyl-tRNA(Gln) amidotransferase subunit A n=2 Tax=Rhodonellum TaxID=336827 RepID=U5BV17_9BACT|nr:MULTISPECIES: Asp-tRNA(Asn)/Glu-tRNA(Gln) amidotransferase subunit GatA [Rhodonellum]ERM84485.1 glutamyl-tRNA(Gln) amidotransferase [Rhodonellum psychrophilum GCM71 = DSM 17998]MDO9552241.1 Asp-tRNA(Asn)/Glu-tRNA(Gln) amidotransferase subunit GatA [Rhodonellum sp.]SDZ01170.1 aspartyl/glutamyl-tRNA(Asn/Gln) amidotransferase subunit A [Rhodonellum ikkaensis]
MEKFISFDEIKKSLENRETDCSAIVKYYLQNIQTKAHLNAFVEVYEQSALAQAELINEKIASGKAGRLAGMVIGIKDVLCYDAHEANASSKILQGFESQFTGTAVQRLIDEDAIVIGRLNCDEFGMGSSNENSVHGRVLNAADETRVPGGSSGGSAVAVQANLCTVSLGTDTGGSVRQPAAFTGIVGIKPTYSRVSRWGLIAYASSFDTIGVFSKTVKDNALVMEIMAGHDNFDSTASRKPVPKYSELLHFDKRVKIAYIKETIESPALQPEIKANTLAVLEKLKNEGHQVEEVDFPLLKYTLPTYYILTTAEASSNLSRFDGVKYGYRTPNAHNLESMYKLTRSEGFGEEVKRRIMLGTFVLSASYYDAYFTKAQKVRRMIKESTEDLLNKFDYIIMPTTPSTAFKFGEHSNDPVAMYLEDLFTVQASVSGVPALSIPNGKDKLGLPIGLQIITNSFKEAELYAFANYLSAFNSN